MKIEEDEGTMGTIDKEPSEIAWADQPASTTENASRPDPREWLATEIGLWGKLRAAAEQQYPKTLSGQKAKEFAFGAINHFTDYYKELEEYPNNKTAITRALNDQINFQALTLQSNVGGLILDLSKENVDDAVEIVELFLASNPKSDFRSLSDDLRKWSETKLTLLHTLDAVEAHVFGWESRAKGALSLAEDAMRSSSRARHEIAQATREHRSELNAHKKQTESEIKAVQDQLSSWATTQQKEVDTLHAVYHKHLQIEAPAQFWSNKARTANVISAGALALFLAGIFAPLWIGYQNWSEIVLFLKEILALSSGIIPLGSITTILIPTLAYAWALKQLSRIFITNRNIADDASYRQVMTKTYLGLSKDANSGISDAERGIILNALFRPAPSSNQDDGPPTGLAELLTSKRSEQ